MALFAFDGMWNHEHSGAHYDRTSNVVRFAQAYRAHKVVFQKRGNELHVVIDDDDDYVSNPGTHHAVAGTMVAGVAGFGEITRVQEAIRRVEQNFRAGDTAIDIVGASRGAAIALHFINEIAERKSFPGPKGEPVPANIRFVGLWDLVAAFGMPRDLGLLKFRESNAGWQTTLPPIVEHSFHALALDERRTLYRPTRLQGAYEVWFRGAHDDVVGSNSNEPLSNIPLRWMLRKAALAGLPVDHESIDALSVDADCPVAAQPASMLVQFRQLGRAEWIHHTVAEKESTNYRLAPPWCPRETELTEKERVSVEGLAKGGPAGPPRRMTRGSRPKAAGAGVPSASVLSSADPRGRNNRPRYAEVAVYFATDREKTDDKKYFGSDQSKTGLHYGRCVVSIPRDHKLARLESPRWYLFEFRPNPAKHVAILSVEESTGDAFHVQLREAVKSSDILVFIHGFNVEWVDSVRRTAQIAYDIGFPGVPVSYSWPSQGRLNPLAYAHDGNASDRTVPHLRRFLHDLSNRSGASRIHVIAHSMGNKALARALDSAVADRSIQLRLDEIALTAPDIDCQVMMDIATRIRPLAQRFTLYASAHDRALAASRQFHNGRRAGDCGEDIVIADGFDTIDASAVDTDMVGHFYYGDNRSVLSDIFYLIRDGKPPAQRFGMKSVIAPDARTYWSFAP